MAQQRILPATGSFNIGQTGANFNRTNTGFYSDAGSFNDGDVLRTTSGPAVQDIFYVFKNGQLFKYFAGSGNGNAFEQQLRNQGLNVQRIAGNTINDFFNTTNIQGAQGFGGNIDPAQFISLAKTPSTTTQTPIDQNSAFTQRAQGTLPAQQFGGGRFLADNSSIGVVPNQPVGSSNTLYASSQDTQLANLPSVAQQALNAMYDKGYVLNPDVTLDANKLAEFLRLAQNEVEPGYQATLKLGRENLLRQLGYGQQELQSYEKDLENKYGVDVRQLAENAADRGFAQSGRRILDENNLAQNYQSNIDAQRRQLAYQSGNAALGYIQQYGSNNLPSIPQINGAPRVLPGQEKFGANANSQGLYQLSPDVLSGIVGSQEKDKNTGIRALAQEYESNYRLGRTLPSYP